MLFQFETGQRLYQVLRRRGVCQYLQSWPLVKVSAINRWIICLETKEHPHGIG